MFPFESPLNTSENFLFSDTFRMYKKKPLERNWLSKIYFPNFTFTHIVVTSFTLSKVFWIIAILPAILITRFKFTESEFFHTFFDSFCTSTASDEILVAPSYPCPRQFFITKFNFSNTCIISVEQTCHLATHIYETLKIIRQYYCFCSQI